MPKVHLISKTNNNIIQHKNINKYNYECIKYVNRGFYCIKQSNRYYDNSFITLLEKARNVNLINKYQFKNLKKEPLEYKETARHVGVLLKCNDKYIIVHQTSKPSYNGKENFFIGQYEYIDESEKLQIKNVYLCWQSFYIQCKNNNDFKEVFWPLNNSPYQYTRFLGNEKIRKDFNVKVNQFIQEGKINLKEAKDITNFLYPKDWFFTKMFFILHSEYGDQMFNQEFYKLKELESFCIDSNKYYFEYFKNKSEIPKLTEE